MPRLYPLVPPIEITTGRVDAIPMRYEKISEFVQSLTIASGTTVTTGVVTLPANVSSTELKTVRAFCTGYTFTIYIKDSSKQPVYAYQNAEQTLVDDTIAVPTTGNLSVEVTTTTGVTGTTSVDVKLGVRYTVSEV